MVPSKVKQFPVSSSFKQFVTAVFKTVSSAGVNTASVTVTNPNTSTSRLIVEDRLLGLLAIELAHTNFGTVERDKGEEGWEGDEFFFAGDMAEKAPATVVVVVCCWWLWLVVAVAEFFVR
jgi:hypothetical protein